MAHGSHNSLLPLLKRLCGVVRSRCCQIAVFVYFNAGRTGCMLCEGSDRAEVQCLPQQLPDRTNNCTYKHNMITSQCLPPGAS
jgi:hypothetical protein